MDFYQATHVTFKEIIPFKVVQIHVAHMKALLSLLNFCVHVKLQIL
jgi:hypothetical protein